MKRLVLLACAAAVGCMPSPSVREVRVAACPAMQGAIAAGIRWLSSVDEGARSENAAWCRATAGVVFSPSPAPVDAGDTVQVLSWNVNAGGGRLASVLSDELGLPCDGVHLPERPVVVLLQESYRAGEEFPARAGGQRAQRPAPEGEHRPGREDIVAVARRCRLGLFYVPAVRNGWGRGAGGFEDRGNAILTSLAMSSPAVIGLSPESARRLVVVADVQVGPDVLRLATTHFTTLPLPWRMLVTGNSSRVRQSETLVQGLAHLESRPVPTLLAGDFNTWSMAEGAMAILRDAFPDSPLALDDTRGPYPTDHVFFRSGERGVMVVPGSYRALDDPMGSDHRPIRMAVALVR